MNLTLLHGFTGKPESFNRVLELLSTTSVKVVCPALLGHAEAAQGSASFDQEITRLHGQLRSLDHLPSHFVGYSLGARVALAFALRYPAETKSLTLIGVNPGLESEAERAIRRDADAARAARILSRGTLEFAREWEAESLFESQRGLAANVLQEQRAIREGHSAEGLAQALSVLGLGSMPNYWPRLSSLALPVVLLNGASDPKFRAIAERFQSLVPSARLRLAPKAGHNLPLEAPEFVARALHEVLGSAGIGA